MIQEEDYLQVMEHEHHLVVHTSDPQKEFLYLDLAWGSYKVGAANLSCNVKRKSVLSEQNQKRRTSIRILCVK